MAKRMKTITTLTINNHYVTKSPRMYRPKHTITFATLPLSPCLLSQTKGYSVFGGRAKSHEQMLRHGVTPFRKSRLANAWTCDKRHSEKSHIVFRPYNIHYNTIDKWHLGLKLLYNYSGNTIPLLNCQTRENQNLESCGSWFSSLSTFEHQPRNE